jgi:[ribosomal protein S5]-alanine N-acetyltransferase
MLAGLSARLNAAQGWGTWVGVEAGVVVVSIAAKAPARAGRVEIGYGVAPTCRGQGHATAAVQALLSDLHHRGLAVVTAESAASNPASGRVLTKSGFLQVGNRTDPEDGLLLMWEHVL